MLFRSGRVRLRGLGGRNVKAGRRQAQGLQQDGGVELHIGVQRPVGLVVAQVAADAVTKIQTGLATPTNITAGTITTVTNLTNAPTAGDLTATMKTSIGTAVAASAVASVTGNVGGNVTGSIGSLATQAKADVNAEADTAPATG